MIAHEDISTRADIVRLVDTFYDAVRADGLIGPIFDEVARVDWSAHLPRMYDFWEAVLFGRSGFKGNPLAVHIELARRTKLGAREFERWLEVFGATVDALFQGELANEAKTRASRIAALMQYHIEQDTRGQQLTATPDAQP